MRIPQALTLSIAMSLTAANASAQQLRAVPADPTDRLIVVVGNLLLNMNPQQDKCYNKDSDTLVEVPCPDVIVAKPDNNAVQPAAEIAALVARQQFVPRAQVMALGAEVPVSEGSYNCYNEDPPNSGNFVRVTCPDIIVIDTTD